MNTKRARWRVTAMRITIAISAGLLLLLVIDRPFAHHAFARGLGIAVSSVISIAGGLIYLRDARRRP